MNVNILQVQLDKERSERTYLENQLREKALEIMNLQARVDAQSSEMTARSVVV